MPKINLEALKGEIKEKSHGLYHLENIVALTHWHHGRPMRIIKNDNPENIAEFYLCAEDGCGHIKYPRLAKILKLDISNIASLFKYRHPNWVSTD